MLVIRRRPGESFVLAGCTVTILDWAGNQARVGIDAPAHVHVRRSELDPICTCPDGCELHPNLATHRLITAAQTTLRAMDRWADLLGDTPPFDRTNMPSRDELRQAIAKAIAQTGTPAPKAAKRVQS